MDDFPMNNTLIPRIHMTDAHMSNIHMNNSASMMKRLLVICSATFALAACEPSKDPSISAQAPAPAPVAAAPVVAEAPAPAATYEFAFTLQGDQASQDPRILRFEDGPCGRTPIAKVATMPLTDAALLPDFVVEFDAGGKETSRWGKPYEAVVIGLEGDRLHFRTGNGQTFWTDTAGAVGVLDAAPVAELDAPLIDCPALPTFAKSEYEQCYSIGGTDDRKRTLAWEGACT